jgi:threonine dehydratase
MRMQTTRPTFDEIVQARERIGNAILNTPCDVSPILSEQFGATIYTKKEFLQETGSFKERGARNALLGLTDEQKKRGVVAASAGNHALALAYHGKLLGIPVRVVMPTIAPLMKQERCRAFGALVDLFGSNIADAKVKADEFVAMEGRTYVHGFDGIDVIAGAGTLGIEILEAIPQADAIIVPIGGAGLIAGMGLAAKSIKPTIEIIGVEPSYCDSYQEAMRHGCPTAVKSQATLGDGLAVPCIGHNAWNIARHVVDRVVSVSEQQIAISILRLLEIEKGVVEGAGAASLAALLTGELDDLGGKHVVLVLCGGNIDSSMLGRVINYGLRCEWRLVRFHAEISDRPGGLEHLTRAIAEAEASVVDIRHERTFGKPDFSRVTIECIIETRDRNHADEVMRRLAECGIPVSLF